MGYAPVMPASCAGVGGDRVADNGVTPGDWVRLVSRLRLDGVVPGGRKGKFLKGTTVKAVAYALASYADYTDGTNVRPGVARIALDCELTYPFASLCIAGLRDLGIIALMRKGTQDGRADEYRLAPPGEWPEDLDVPTPTAYDLTVRRLAEANRRKSRTRVRNGGTSSVDNSHVPASETGVRAVPAESRTPVNDGAHSHVPPSTTVHVPPSETGATEPETETPSLTETDARDLRTDVAVVGYPQAGAA